MSMATTTDDDGVRQSRARLVAASHAARRRIERELHDGPQQHLVAMAVKLMLVEAALDADPDEARRALVELRHEMQAAVQQLRELAYDIYPPLLADRGLVEALRAAVARVGRDVRLSLPGDARRYPPEIEAAVYFSCLEAVESADGPLSVEVANPGAALVFEVRGRIPDAVVTDITDRTDTLGGTVTVVGGVDGIDLSAALPLA